MSSVKYGTGCHSDRDSVHPEDLEWRLLNREHKVPYLMISQMDWLNYDAS